MRIASWNIKDVKKRQGLLLDWLSARKPDLVALQKIVAQRENFDTFTRAGYYVEAHCSPRIPHGNYGVAILSLQKPRILQKGLPGQERYGPRLLTVEVNGLEFSSVYAPDKKENPSAGTKIEWFDSLISHLRATHPPSGQSVLCGDFNVVPKGCSSRMAIISR